MADIYTAKKFGWDQTPEDFGERGFDMFCDIDDENHDHDDLEGELEVFEWPNGQGECHLVGGVEADPKTIRKKGERRRKKS